MTHFTEEQLKELETLFDLKRTQEVLPVRDGVVIKNQKVWWRGEDGPQHVLAEKEWANIREFPNLYQLAEPRVQVIYVD